MLGAPLKYRREKKTFASLPNHLSCLFSAPVQESICLSSQQKMRDSGRGVVGVRAIGRCAEGNVSCYRGKNCEKTSIC